MTGKRVLDGCVLLRISLLVLLMAACGPASRQWDEPGEAPGIVLISVDTLRRDQVSAYGSSRKTTPSLDRLAREGALFENAVSGSNWTLPAHMSLMTGLVAPAHGVEDDLHGLSPSILTLAQVLKKQGYSTCGFASHVYLEARYGFSRGFDRYQVRVNQSAAQVTASAAGWLEKQGRVPFFLFLHYFDPHWPFTPPPPFGERFGGSHPEAGAAPALFHFLDPDVEVSAEQRKEILALYQGEVAYTDHQIGRLMEVLRQEDLLDKTIIAVLSDHGEEFWDHGAFGHGTHLHGEITRVPLLLRYPPRIQAGTVEPELALLRDLPATLLSLAGVPVPAQFTRDGRDLLSPRPDEAARMAVLETTRWGPRRFAVQSLRYKLIGAGVYQPVAFTGPELKPVHLSVVVQPPQLFDILADPLEMKNLMGEPGYQAVRRKLADALQRHADRSVPGLRLRCTSTGGKVSYGGLVSLDGTLLDDEFALLPGPQALVAPVREGLFRIRLHPEGEPSDLIFPLAQDAGKMTLHLLRNGREVFDRVIPIPPPGGRFDVYGSPGDGCQVWNPWKPDWMRRTPVRLGSEDLERLRSLGYVQ